MNPEVVLAQLEAQGKLDMVGIKDEADAMVHLAVCLACAFEDGDIDKYMDMPYQKAMLLVEELDRRAKELKRHAATR